jgi:hypothetical protein
LGIALDFPAPEGRVLATPADAADEGRVSAVAFAEGRSYHGSRFSLDGPKTGMGWDFARVSGRPQHGFARFTA